MSPEAEKLVESFAVGVAVCTIPAQREAYSIAKAALDAYITSLEANDRRWQLVVEAYPLLANYVKAEIMRRAAMQPEPPAKST